MNLARLTLSGAFGSSRQFVGKVLRDPSRHCPLRCLSRSDLTQWKDQEMRYLDGVGTQRMALERTVTLELHIGPQLSADAKESVDPQSHVIQDF